MTTHAGIRLAPPMSEMREVLPSRDDVVESRADQRFDDGTQLAKPSEGRPVQAVVEEALGNLRCDTGRGHPAIQPVGNPANLLSEWLAAR